jgi:hypothetical protein
MDLILDISNYTLLVFFCYFYSLFGFWIGKKAGNKLEGKIEINLLSEVFQNSFSTLKNQKYNLCSKPNNLYCVAWYADRCHSR